MTHWENIHTDRVAGFDIVVSVAPEEIDPNDLFDDDGESARAIAEGRYAWFMVRVEVQRHGVTLGTDCLGGCCYESPQEFIKTSGYYEDMVESAVNDARDTLAKITETV